MIPKPFLGLLSAGALALAVAACGGSSSTSSSTSTAPPAAASTTSAAAATTGAPASSTSSAAAAPTGATTHLSIAANPGGMLMFTKKTLTARAGTVIVAFTNKSPLGHNFTVKSSSGTIVGATPTFSGGTKTLTLHLKAGTYGFLCTVPGHAAAGMTGTLTVTS